MGGSSPSPPPIKKEKSMEVLVWICSLIVVIWFYGKLFGIFYLLDKLGFFAPEKKEEDKR